MAAVILILLVYGVWLLFHSETRHAIFKAGRSSQLTSEPGIKLDQAVSPDGKMIAYSTYFNGILRVQVKQVTGGRTICLTEGMPGYQRNPQWSADGSEIAFNANLSFTDPSSTNPSLERFVVPALGGAPRKTSSGVCSPDGKHIAFVSGDTIYLQDANGEKRKMLTVMSEPNFLCWSSDGSLIAFVSGNSAYLSSIVVANIAPSSIHVINLASGYEAKITDNTSLNMSPIWSSDGRHLFFISNRDGTRDIYTVALGRSGQSEGKPERLTTGLNVYTISLSADSKMLTYSVMTQSANLWFIKIPQVKWVSVKEATQVTTGNQVIESSGISADGQWLAYDCNRDGIQHIFKLLLKDGEPIQLTRDSRDDFAPSWSTDGKMIVFHSFRTGNREIFVMLNDGTQQQQVTHDSAEGRYLDWSPDGNQIVYNSDKSGQGEIYLASRNTSTGDWDPPRQITFDGGYKLRWSPDGLSIAYIFAHDLRVISPQGGKPRVLITSDNPSVLPIPAFPGWSRDSHTVYYKAVDESQRSSFWAVPLSGGKPRLLVKFDDPARQSNRTGFTTDGKRFFFTISKYESDIWKMELINEE